MPRAFLILLISWAYIGCATLRPPATEPAGGRLRLLQGDRPTADAVRLAALSEPLAPDGLALDWEFRGTAVGGGGCWIFRLDALARFPDGTAVQAVHVVEAWERGLRDAEGAQRWLLRTVDGAAAVAAGRAAHASGLEATDRDLTICVDRPTPDLLARLAHPDLWLWRDAGFGLREGSGPFSVAGPRLLVHNPAYSRRLPSIDRIEWIEGEADDRALLLALGETDLSVVYGRAAVELADKPLTLSRIPSWDRVYALWLNPRSRWTNDPTFRRWLAGRIDRPAMVRYLFAGGAVPATGLLPGDPATPAKRPDPGRPLASTSRPRLSCLVDADDPYAASIVARLEAELDAAGVDLASEPLPRAAFRRRLAAGDAGVALVAHHPPVDEPILALESTFRRLSPSAADAVALLERSAAIPDATRRLASARRAEAMLLADARLIPLVRVHGWLASNPRLRGIAAGPHGILRLRNARWVP